MNTQRGKLPTLAELRDIMRNSTVRPVDHRDVDLMARAAKLLFVRRLRDKTLTTVAASACKRSGLVHDGQTEIRQQGKVS